MSIFDKVENRHFRPTGAALRRSVEKISVSVEFRAILTEDHSAKFGYLGPKFDRDSERFRNSAYFGSELVSL